MTIKWTPCSERLPDKPGKYLITFRETVYNGIEEKPKTTVCSYYRDGKEFKWSKAKYGRVTAWAEMPEPYTEDIDG